LSIFTFITLVAERDLFRLRVTYLNVVTKSAKDCRRTKNEYRILSRVDESRKRVIGIMAAILAARKLHQLESTRPSPALHCAIHDAVIFAERIMQVIDDLFPSPRRTG